MAELTERRLRLLAYLDELDELTNFERFRNRLIFQKKVYFLQESGANLGYPFGFYIRGPYSSAVADDGFYISGLLGLEENIGTLLVSRPDRELVTRMEHFFDEITNVSDGDEDYWYELISSLHFIYKHAYPPARNKNEVFARLDEEKPGRFSDEDKNTAWSILERFDLLS